jgi:flagellar biosynthesis protein FliQ
MTRGALLAVVATAALAAALSHVAIDVAGDVLLPHDTYDDVAHDARSVTAVLTLAMIVVAAARTLMASLRTRAAFAPARIRTFVPAVLALALPLVVLMEWTDAMLAGHPVDDLGDLFGGSIVLGAGTTTIVSIALALVCAVVLRWFARATVAFARAIAGQFQRRLRSVPPALATCTQAVPSAFAEPLANRSAAKRGPPLLVR